VEPRRRLALLRERARRTLQDLSPRLRDESRHRLVAGIQPSVSPDGKSIAYEQGGLRVLDLGAMQSRVVREEETEYRMKPAWTPDGQNILYVTEDKGLE
jgi:Tol biopolymer transport system component